MPNLKQGTLSFTSAKRTNSIYNGKKTLIAEKGKIRRVDRPVEAQDDAKPSDAIVTFSDEEDTATAKISVPVKRTRTSTKTQSSSATAKQGLTQPPSSKTEEPSRAGIEGEHLDVEDKAGHYRNYYNEVRSKMGYMQPVHSDGHNKIHHMLRFFDMSSEFGPCIGMTRLERWERAEAFGLNPPVEVRDILLTKEGVEKAEYAQCVLHGEV